MNLGEHLREEVVVPYLDGRLEARERAEVERHIEACANCRRQVAELRALMGVLGEWRAVEPSAAFTAALRARLEAAAEPRGARWAWRWVYVGGAAVAAAILLVVALRQPSRPPAVAPTETAQTTEAPAEEASDDLATVEPVLLENYDLLEEFDILFETQAKREPQPGKRGT